MSRATLILLLSLSGARVLEAAPVPRNLTQGRAASLYGQDGSVTAVSSVTDGLLAPEGAPAAEAEAVALDGPRAALVVAFGGTTRIGALLLQVTDTDVYYVEASADLQLWTTCWRSAPMSGQSALRTRTVVLSQPVDAKWLRVRATTQSSPRVSELQAYMSPPSPWPPPLDLSRLNARLPLWPSLTRERSSIVYAALGTLLFVAVTWSVAAGRDPAAGQARARRAVLGALAAAAIVGWPNLLNFHYHTRTHQWEFFHYYLGGKYLPELGYTRLYACTAVADAEQGVDISRWLLRDLRDDSITPASAAVQSRAQECRSAFSSSRWASFGSDVRTLRRWMGPSAWASARTDHGFNATPAWAVLPSTLMRAGPASDGQLALLALLDPALLLGLLAVIAWAFGWEAACIAAGYWGVNALGQFGWTGGGLLRYDWLFALVVGLAALKRNRAVLAGFALTYAALVRIFPVFVLGALVLKVAVECLEHRSVQPARRRAAILVGSLAAVLLVGAASVWMNGGTWVWREAAANIEKHMRTQSGNTLGVILLLSHEPEARLELLRDPLLPDSTAPWAARRALVQRRMRGVQWAVALGYVLLLALAVRGVPDWLAAVLGLGLMPILLKLSSYYYAAYVGYAAAWPAASWIGLALVAVAWATQVVAGFWPRLDEQDAVQSLVIVAFSVIVTGGFAWRHRGAGSDTAD
jgi:hypothetical protein